MIDRRAISYTEGSYLSPVVNGRLMQTSPTVSVDSGITVSTHNDKLVNGKVNIGKTEAEENNENIDLKDPLGSIGRVGGITPQQAIDFWTLIFGSAEQQQKTALGMTGGATQYIEGIIFPEGTTKAIQEIPRVDFAGSDIPVLPAIDKAIEGAGDVIGGIAGDSNGILGGLGKTILIGATVIGGIYLIGKWLGKGK